MQTPVRLGNYVVTSDSERFSIFPKDRFGRTMPVQRVNHFLYIRHADSHQQVVLKRYLHMKKWYWKDSRDQKPCDERVVLTEVARMLFGGDLNQAGELLVRMLTGAALAA